MCGLTVNNCKANLRSLQAKLAVEAEAAFSNTTATTYRVYSFAEILRRREAAGLTHVIRSKGSQFVHPETGIPVTGTAPVPVTGIPDWITGIPGTGQKGIPDPGTHLRKKKEERDPQEDAAAAACVSLAVGKFVSISAAAAAKIVASCREYASSASSEEIAHFCEVKLLQIQRDPSVKNPIALLISSVQEYSSQVRQRLNYSGKRKRPRPSLESKPNARPQNAERAKPGKKVSSSRSRTSGGGCRRPTVPNAWRECAPKPSS